MKDFDVCNVIEIYCSIAKLKDKEYVSPYYLEDRLYKKEAVATHVFGAQQLAWLYWSEGSLPIDVFKVNTLLAFHLVGDIKVPAEIRRYVDEYEQNSTIESRFAHMCSDLEDFLNALSPVYTVGVMEFIKKYHNEFSLGFYQTKNVLDHYETLCELKYKVRRGWISWNVNVEHREVVAEHVFGTQILAWLMHSATNDSSNISKIMAILALHETEESIMEDYIPCDNVSPEDMLKEGKAAVKKALGGIRQFDFFDSLLDEFNAHKTYEARFSYLCDKLECNFRAKMYTDLGLCPIENGSYEAQNDPEVIENLSKGAKTVSDLFLMHIMHVYIGTPFEKVANTLRGYDTSKI